MADTDPLRTQYSREETDGGNSQTRQSSTNLKDREPRLRQEEEELRRIIDLIPQTIIILDPDGKIIYGNRTMLEYTGLSLDEVCADDFRNRVVHPEDLERLREQRRQALTHPVPFENEQRVLGKDGNYRWFLIVYNPLLDEQGRIVRWYVAGTDITESKQAKEALQASELKLRQVIDTIPALVWCHLPDGSREFVNKRWNKYTGLSEEESFGWGWQDVIHPEDLPRTLEKWQSVLASGEASEIEARLRRHDGVYRWFLLRAEPLRDEAGKIVRWFGTSTDIDDRRQAESKLREEKHELRQITDTIRQVVVVLAPDGSTLYANRVALDTSGVTLDEAIVEGMFAQVIHPDDVDRLRAEREERLLRGAPFELEVRALKNGQYHWYLLQYNPLKNERDQIIRWYVTGTDIDDRKNAEEAVRSNERNLSLIINTIPTWVWSAHPDGAVEFASHRWHDYTGLSTESAHDWGWSTPFHPKDLDRVRDYWRSILASGEPGEIEARIRRFDGEYRWFLIRASTLRDESGSIVKWYGANIDIDDRKRAEQKLQESEAHFRTVTDTVPQAIVVLTPDGTTIYANRVTLDITGLTLDEVLREGTLVRACHPDDLDRLIAERRAGLLKGVPFEMEVHALFKREQYRWQLMQYNPLKDEHGQIIRWYATATDIDDRKKAEERLRNENIALREEIDRSSMFEEIVSSCEPMRQLLSQVEKVAPSDSTVLILGETGTGKELIARALHRRSKRASRAFIRVNCAAIPQSLIASELFGHEKGAFTGAIQRRPGRFEAADGGTLFLDEVGDLPMETQIALLRVLQEKEFERVGSNHPTKVDVRLIAATNRDLQEAVAAGAFRQDLFYRLNVFPITVPPLRERAEDIPLLVEYLVARFVKGAGKNIRHIGKRTLQHLQRYHWPGNIRELQNVVERAVILCETDTFVVDESWLKGESAGSSPRESLSALADREVEMIEAALAECHGRISGPSGAAAKLGIPRQTLESKIRRLGIDKHGQKRSHL